MEKSKNTFVTLFHNLKKLIISEKKQNEGKETEIHDYDELQAEFVAGLFESDEVTKEAILNGVDSHDFKQVYDIVRYRVLGFSREEDEAAKKAMMEQLLLGQDSTTFK